MWVTYLRAAEIVELDRCPVTDDACHKDVKTLLKLYTMESFLYKTLNRACRDKDTAVIDTLGPFAHALMSIIDEANVNREDRMKGPFELFRGLKSTKEEVDMYRGLARRKASYQMLGYTSTSRNQREAIKFAVDDVKPDEVSVVFRIRMENESGKYLFSLDSEDYTMYPEEEEVLI